MSEKSSFISFDLVLSILTTGIQSVLNSLTFQEVKYITERIFRQYHLFLLFISFRTHYMIMVHS